MRLLGKDRLEKFIKQHSWAESALRRWQKLMTETDYKNIMELRNTFPSADFVEGKTVFDVGGNKIRTITTIEYGIRQVLITHVLTHKEYDRGKWKD